MVVEIGEPEDDSDAEIKDAAGKKIATLPTLTTRQRSLGKYLVMAGGDASYLMNIAKARALEKVMKFPPSDIRRAGKLAAAVRTGKVSEYLDSLTADFEDSELDLKHSMDRALSVIKKMLKFGVSVEVFTEARQAVRSYLEAKGHTFDDVDPEDEQQEDELQDAA